MKTYKLLLLACLFSPSARAQKAAYLDTNAPIEQRVEDALSRMTLEEKVKMTHAQSKFSSAGCPRLGIPDVWMSDGPHGVRPEVLWDEWNQAGWTNDSCVAFPALTCLAATWNPDLALLYGQSIGQEALFRGKTMLLGPGVNINRTPLNGRNFEYMGEDPYLSSRIVVPYIQGVQSQGVSTCVKHFALNNQEFERYTVNVTLSDRALYEIYLPAFKAAITEGHSWGIMPSYNLFEGQQCGHNRRLLLDILKGEWKFDGVTVSDWGAVHSTEEAANNGLDMEFGTGTDGLTTGARNAYDSYYLALPYLRGLREGKYSEEGLNDKVRRILRLIFRTTMSGKRGFGSLCSDEHYAAARQIGAQGLVLLRNEHQALPIATDAKILVVGENAIKMMTVGGGSSSLKVQHEISPLDGLRERFPNVTYCRGYVGSTDNVFDGVQSGQDLTESRSAEELTREAVEAARQADYVVFIGGLNKSYHQDTEGADREQYELPYGQNELIQQLAKANKNTIVLVVSGNAVQMPWNQQVAAIMQTWYLGSEMGHSIADVLSGDVNPSGKLPFSIYANLQQCAAHSVGEYPGTKRANENIWDEHYSDDIFVGYRHLDKQKLNPTYPFGFGLSYTTFQIGKPSLSAQKISANGTITVTVPVTNTGRVAGNEVVQVYVSDLKCSVPRPVRELKGFRKVSLQPGETQNVSITLDKSALSYFDADKHDWVVEPGMFEVCIGNSSRNLVAKAKFEVEK